MLVENQLERTDHGHLGQIMTYAAGLQTGTIVWIPAAFTPEHRAALDWINAATSRDFSFFGIEVELWPIDESRSAPALRGGLPSERLEPGDLAGGPRLSAASFPNSEGSASSTGPAFAASSTSGTGRCG